MKLTRFVIVALLGCIVFSAPVFSRELTEDKIQILRTIIPSSGFKYFSGYFKNYHNHPAIYAHGYKENATLTVVGKDYLQEFPMSESSKAFQAYRALLFKRGYQPSGSASNTLEFTAITGDWKEYWGTPGKTDVTYHDRYRISRTSSSAYEVKILNRKQRIYGEHYDGRTLRFSQRTNAFVVKYSLSLRKDGRWLIGTATTPKKTVDIKWQRIK